METQAIHTPFEILVFEMGGRRYALSTQDVTEIVRAVTILPLPLAPPIVEGIINARGTMIPVLDIRTRFQHPWRAAIHTDYLILAKVDSRRVALRVDQVLCLAQLNPMEIVDPETIVPRADYVAGVVQLEDGLILIHDLRTFLSEAESITLDKALQARDTHE